MQENNNNNEFNLGFTIGNLMFFNTISAITHSLSVINTTNSIVVSSTKLTFTK